MLLEKNAERLVEGKVDRNVESQVEQKVMSTFSISSTSTSDFGVRREDDRFYNRNDYSREFRTSHSAWIISE